MTRPLLEIANLNVTFRGRRSILPWRRGRDVQAVQSVSLTIGAGETVGLVGESGSGKSTVGRAILHLLRPDSGTIRLADFDVTAFGRREPDGYRRAVQVVFQDPVASLNPAMVVGQIVGEPLGLHYGMKRAAQRRRVAELLVQVGLQPDHADRFPYEFSGGQRQRIAIARALASEPDLIVLDEPVSALDVSTQSQVINLLEDLQSTTGAAYLMIAHDLAVVRHVCQRILVMYRSRIVEEGSSDDVCERPAHPYTELLLASIPDPNPEVQREKARHRRELAVENAKPVATTGCPFAEHCPHTMDICLTTFPEPTQLPWGSRVSCHLYNQGETRDPRGSK